MAQELESAPLMALGTEPQESIGRHRGRLFAGLVAGVGAFACLAFYGTPGHVMKTEVTNEIIGESHYTRNCAFKCNSDFFQTKEEMPKYRACCAACPGGECTYPCTESCQQKKEKSDNKCGRDHGGESCLEMAHEDYETCCSGCPGKTCMEEKPVNTSKPEPAKQETGPTTQLPVQRPPVQPVVTPPKPPTEPLPQPPKPPSKPLPQPPKPPTVPLLQELQTPTPPKMPTPPKTPPPMHVPAIAARQCPETLELFGGLCFKKCSSINREYPHRASGLTCCKSATIGCELKQQESVTDQKNGAGAIAVGAASR